MFTLCTFVYFSPGFTLCTFVYFSTGFTLCTFVFFSRGFTLCTFVYFSPGFTLCTFVYFSPGFTLCTFVYFSPGFTLCTFVYFFQGSLYAPFLHDVVYLYLLSVNETLRLGGDPRNGTFMFNVATTRKFTGIFLVYRYQLIRHVMSNISKNISLQTRQKACFIVSIRIYSIFLKKTKHIFYI